MPDSNMETVKAKHREVLEGMSNRDLVLLLMADDPSRFPEDEWFRDLIRDVLKTRKLDDA